MGFLAGILYFVFCIIVGRAASNRGRSGFGYFLLSLLLSPIIGCIIVIVLGENKYARQERIYEEAEIKEAVSAKYKNRENIFRNVKENSITYEDTKKCPFCAELIKREAIVCRFCGNSIKSNDVVESISLKKVKSLSYDDFINPYIVLSDTILKESPDVNSPEITDIYCNDVVDFLSDAYEDTDINNIWYKIKYKDYEDRCLRTSIKKID